MFRVESVQDGRIQDTSGEIIYRVCFAALVFKPFKGEVLDGVVSAVDSEGFTIRSGPLESFVSGLRIAGEYAFDSQTNSFVSKRETNQRIRQDSEIRYRLDQIKYDKGHYVRNSQT